MSTLKDKLSANMRAVKAAQNGDKPESEADKAPAAPAKKTRKPAKRAARAKRKPAATPAAQPKTATPRLKAPAPASGNVVPENSNTTLFPVRVWPD